MGTQHNGWDGEEIQFRSQFDLYHFPRSTIISIRYGCNTNVLDKQTEKCEHLSPSAGEGRDVGIIRVMDGAGTTLEMW